MTYNYDVSDPSFLADLRESQESVDRVAKWLREKGYPVVVRPTFERPDPTQMSNFSDSGDLEILQRVEVKQRKSLTFTSRDDFAYPTLIVDACHCYDNARPKPFAYVILNRSMTAAFLVPNASRSHWLKIKKYDRFKGRERCFYECPIEHVQFVTL
jgi:hypothetical protein